MSDMHSEAHAYVVGALTPDEVAHFETHLQDCGGCRSEVAEMQEVTFQLSAAVATAPPPALRATVLASIAQTPQLPRLEAPSSTPWPAHRAAFDSASSTSPTPVATSDRTDNVVPLRRRSRERLATTLLAAAAVLAAFTFGGIAWQSRQVSQEHIAKNERLVQVLGAEDVRTVQGRFVRTNFTGSVVMSKQQGTAMFVADDLPPLPEGKVYEAWTIKGDPRPAGTFAPDDSQPALIELPDAAFRAESVAITVEPEGGSQQPTSDAVFTVLLPRA